MAVLIKPESKMTIRTLLTSACILVISCNQALAEPERTPASGALRPKVAIEAEKVQTRDAERLSKTLDAIKDKPTPPEKPKEEPSPKQ